MLSYILVRRGALLLEYGTASVNIEAFSSDIDWGRLVGKALERGAQGEQVKHDANNGLRMQVSHEDRQLLQHDRYGGMVSPLTYLAFDLNLHRRSRLREYLPIEIAVREEAKRYQ